ncbi:UNVERIFIED_CONTAM: hypothetical protein K2H54_060175 [Gekko kuhli]
MEDEEGSVALNFQSAARGQNRNNSKLPVEDILVKQPSRNQITARIGCVVMFLLIGALIAHRIWGTILKALLPVSFQLIPARGGTGAAIGKMTEDVSDASSPSNNATCKLCPENWFLYEEKCYWISKEKGSWKKGKEDCTARSSQLLVMPKQKDMHIRGFPLCGFDVTDKKDHYLAGRKAFSSYQYKAVSPVSQKQ